jgi:hypothetical protein
MKVYFSASIVQKEQFGHNYDQIVRILLDMGHAVEYKHITEKTLDQIKSSTHEDSNNFYKKVCRWISQADLVVVEASFPSTLNIGHEISLALEKGKPTIVFYHKGYESYFLPGLKSDKLFLVEYEDRDLPDLVKETVNYAKDQADTRFNFFMSPSHINYLDWISQHRRIPRSVYLRDLIEKDREKNKEYGDE